LDAWEQFRNNILDDVSRLEEVADRLSEDSLNAKLIKDAAAVKRKLLGTRTLLGQLRRAFMYSAAEVVHG
jgi:hypothetical protein